MPESTFRSGSRGSIWSAGSADDLRAIWPGARFEASDDRFAAEVVRARMGEVVLEAVTTTPHLGVRGARATQDAPRRSLSIDVVTSGSMWRQDASGAYVQGAGQAALTFNDEPFAYRWRTAGRVLRCTLPLDAVRARIPGASSMPRGVIDGGPRIDGYVSFMRNLLVADDAGSGAEVELERAVWWLQLAVLRQVAGPVPAASQVDLRSRVLQHIEAHLFDQGLTVPGIAASLGVSVRSVHNAFDQEGTTAASSIRSRRVRAVAASLRCETVARPNGALAADFGFRSAALLQRSFVEVLGTSIGRYRQEHGPAAQHPGRSLRTH